MSQAGVRKIIHCDCDCFYAAVEMRDNPALAQIPLAIGGSAQRRGVIATCNYPARKFGIRSAMPTAQALKLCPELHLMPGNMAKYKAVSAQVMAIFRRYTELVEPLSLDEAYLDVSDCRLHHGSATRIAEALRAEVKAQTGITISAGVAPNKFVAKVASDWNKPDGLCVVPPEQLDSFVAALKVEKIPGVGAKTAARLHQLNLYTCADLRAFGQPGLVEHFGRFGARLAEVAYGRDERPVRPERVRKSCSVEHTYAEDLASVAECIECVPELIAELEARFARHAGRYRITACVAKVKFNDFQQTTIEQAGGPCAERFVHLIETAWQRGGRPVRLLGLGYRLAENDSGGGQLSLF